jgi:hypothetical protein
MDVRSLQARFATYSAEYADGRANHLPMALDALCRMGARDERLTSFATGYLATHDLEPASAFELEARARYRERFAERGRSRAIAEALDELVDAAASSFFHPLIRTAYALGHDDDEELAAALAFWHLAARRIGPPPISDGRAAGDIAETFRGLRAIVEPEERGTLLIDRIAAIADQPTFGEIVHGRPTFDELDRAEWPIVLLFGQTRSFSLVHILTALHAWRTIARYAGEAALRTEQLWMGICATYVVAGAPPMLPALREERRMSAATLPNWDEILRYAIASEDDHVVKATYALWQHPHAGDPIFRWAAARYARVPPRAATA